MTKDFIAICATTLAIGISIWSLREDKPPADRATAETSRVLAEDPALKFATERSPYMRNER